MQKIKLTVLTAPQNLNLIWSDNIDTLFKKMQSRLRTQESECLWSTGTTSKNFFMTLSGHQPSSIEQSALQATSVSVIKKKDGQPSKEDQLHPGLLPGVSGGGGRQEGDDNQAVIHF